MRTYWYWYVLLATTSTLAVGVCLYNAFHAAITDTILFSLGQLTCAFGHHQVDER